MREHHQNWAEPFNEARSNAMARRQQAVDQAHRVLHRAMAREIDRHRQRYEEAREAFDAVKDNPNHPSHNEAREAFEVLRGPGPLSRLCGT